MTDKKPTPLAKLLTQIETRQKRTKIPVILDTLELIAIEARALLNEERKNIELANKLGYNDGINMARGRAPKFGSETEYFNQSFSQ
jgi:hypothetical protein